LKAKNILAGSNFARDELIKYLPKKNVNVLTYGIKDISETGKNLLKKKKNQNKTKKFKVALFGSFEPRKGQDIFLEAIKLLPKSEREKCDFYFYGRILDENFYNKLLKNAKKMTDCKIQLNLDHDLYIDEMNSVDIVIVPSREDTLPLISLDALAAGKILICSRTTGTSSFIKHGKSGFIMEENTPADVKNTLLSAITSKDLKEITKNGRYIFDSNFSKKIFSKKLIELIGD
jgi:glycosyltransferase involved in cell wall biosynthesis